MRSIGAALAALTLLSVSTLGSSTAEAQKRQRDLITRQELESSDRKIEDLYQAVRSLRPHFLAPPRGVRTMGAAPPAPTVVYVDGSKQGDIEMLKTMLAKDVDEVRYLDPTRAQEEYGVTHSGGALLIKLVKYQKPAAKPDSGRGSP